MVLWARTPGFSFFLICCHVGFRGGGYLWPPDAPQSLRRTSHHNFPNYPGLPPGWSFHRFMIIQYNSKQNIECGLIKPSGRFSTPPCLEHCSRAQSWGEAISSGNRDNIIICSQPCHRQRLCKAKQKCKSSTGSIYCLLAGFLETRYK